MVMVESEYPLESESHTPYSKWHTFSQIERVLNPLEANELETNSYVKVGYGYDPKDPDNIRLDAGNCYLCGHPLKVNTIRSYPHGR